MFESGNLYKFVPKSSFYPTIFDAVAFATKNSQIEGGIYLSWVFFKSNAITLPFLWNEIEKTGNRIKQMVYLIKHSPFKHNI